MSIAFIALGANLGEPATTLQGALRELDRIPDTRVLQHSRLYRSRAVGPGNQPDYVNAVAQVETSLPPHALLDALLGIEALHGRVRDGQRWGPRTLDLDLLIYADLQISDPRLTLPHPEMTHRNFVLVPLLEIDPELLIPGHGPARQALQSVGSEGLALCQ
ncbi:MAG: 2-amino-4-hydroxy-6-hydroxymethyldihydropteridine diphosphokinase [Gammaproteobacteria bacterium RIFCSPLOWO2_02_FULL_61_13]|nr:MAG: 2-amino-4-hydroxy-6-hydroxymethyldihydropteridine diphosphokinase [Gammaproteobacteria bacterium RIFCSPLOWO2_02_FULL_61_13]